MNQDFHILCSMLGEYKRNNSKEDTIEYINKNAAAIEIMDSFRCRLDRQITHFVAGSYWKMPESLEKLKESKEDDMDVYFSEQSQKSKDWCVNGLMDFRNLIKMNPAIFSKENVSEYGIQILIHSLQDFYTDIVWRLMYNFENQGKEILKTQDAVEEVDSDVTPMNVDRKQKPKYTKLDQTLKLSDKKFREEYKTINCYSSYFLAKKLEELGFDICGEEEKDFFSKLHPYLSEVYPQDVYDKSSRYMNFLPETKEALRNEEKAEELKSNIRQIFGKNADLFIKSIENCVDANEEAERMAEQLTNCIKDGKISDEDINRIFSKQLRIAENVNRYQRKVYSDYQKEEVQESK